jgi:hypothetical protein
MTPYEHIVQAIIQKQMQVLGQMISVSRARRVSGIIVDDEGRVLSLSGEPLKVISDLVNQYRELIGPAAVSFSQDATTILMKEYPSLVLPELLTNK